MKRKYNVFLLGLLLAGCSTTAPVLDRVQWLEFSTAYPGGFVSWRAPASAPEAGFAYHATQITSQDINSGKVYTLLWHQGYDVNSWGYPAFILQIDVQKYYSTPNVKPSLESFRQDHMKRLTNALHVMDEVELGGRRWLRITADYHDKLNACRRIKFQMPLNGECYLNVMAEYDNEAIGDQKWLESRMAVMSNVIDSIRLDLEPKAKIGGVSKGSEP